MNGQVNIVPINEYFDNFAMYENFYENLDDVAGLSQTNGGLQETGASKNNSDFCDIEIIEVHVNKDLEKPNCSKQKSKVSNHKRIISWDSETSEKSEESEEPVRPLRNQKSKQQKLTPSPLPETETAPTHPNPKSKRQWWLELPAPCTTKRLILSRRENYVFNENIVMLGYLIINHLIEKGTSRKPWKKMLMDGYLTHRTVESLNNHFRRTLLPNIESFKLPQDIEAQFQKCRKFYINHK